MGYNDYWQHKYKVIRLSESGHEVSSEVVLGSRAALKKVEELEEQGLLVEVFNLTKGVKEYPVEGKV